MIYRYLVLIHVCTAFPLKCPEPAQWSSRSRGLCPDPSKYSCVRNGLIQGFSENCTIFDFQRAGRKSVLNGGFDAFICSVERYQPWLITYYTNVSTNCIFLKSVCNEEGQVVYGHGNRNTDTTCRCDYTRGYDFLTKPQNRCFCVPSEEDCSCYLKTCNYQIYFLSPDYECIHVLMNTSATHCKAINRERVSKDRNDSITDDTTRTKHIQTPVQRKLYSRIIIIALCIGFIIVYCIYELKEKSTCKETLKSWYDSVKLYGSTQTDKNQDGEQGTKPALRSNTKNKNRHDIPNNKEKTTCQNGLEPPVIAIATHMDQCKTKKVAESQTEQEYTTDQKKDGDRFRFDIHVQKDMKKKISCATEMNMAKMVKVALNLLPDALFDLLKLETYGDCTYHLRSRNECDITFLYGEHRRLNKHAPSNSTNRYDPWGGGWQDIIVTDQTLGDDIERIRLTRNELQHMKSFALDNTRYNELCSILHDVLNRFDKHSNPSHLYIDRLNEILHRTVDGEDVEYIKMEVRIL